MSPSKVIKLPIENITITLYPNGSGAVTSDIPLDADISGYSGSEGAVIQATLDAQRGILYTMIQVHATAGIDVLSEAYLKGVRAALDEIQG